MWECCHDSPCCFWRSFGRRVFFMCAILICRYKCLANLVIALLGSNMPVSLVPTWRSSKGYYCNIQNLQPHWAAGVPCMDVKCFDIHGKSSELQMEVLTESWLGRRMPIFIVIIREEIPCCLWSAQCSPWLCTIQLNHVLFWRAVSSNQGFFFSKWQASSP